MAPASDKPADNAHHDDCITDLPTPAPACAPPALPPGLAAPPDLLAEARALDAADALGAARARFNLPAPVYLCGNSLGAQPRAAAAAVHLHLQKWARAGVNAHFESPHAWATIEDDAAALSVPVVGARHAHEVAVCNSLTANLHLMLVAFYRPTPEKYRVLVETPLFPSDLYALQTHLRSRGVDPDDALIRLRPRAGEHVFRDCDVVAAVDAHAHSLALVFLPGVQYVTGQVFPMAAVGAACRAHGVPYGLGLAHAVGNVELSLHDWGVDFAVWCTYKYLNAGPGAVAGLFVHDRHARADLHRFAGWWGHDRATRFDMRAPFAPRPGAQGFQLSNPPVLAVAPVAAALRELRDAGGVPAVRAKSIAMSRFLDAVLARVVPGDAVQLVTPSEPHRRGAQASLRVGGAHASVARELQARLERRGVVCDVREPDVLRVSLAPLYNRFEDVVWFGVALRDALEQLGVVAAGDGSNEERG